ncbi:hypothetical protein sscle_01g002150 [Sclerotinia sclerotiorum 1980 UF-70]|uniref:Uncharacterized protein n=1 Tax=Sclerotinia sclerotiorum (strain ATCC 18683 / 1980 / Ss-1) TaxID=665079 RepID=A0A1D9PRT7_SCLS1|nr:hypothetical protein sscle_01g002150 [Sclerotinia sclerotiorum 1980 UF-70]
MWRELFKNQTFPGIKPKPIAGAVTSKPQPAKDRGTNSTGDKKAKTNASAAIGKGKNNTPKADPSPAGRSNTLITGETPARGKVNTPRAHSHATPKPQGAERSMDAAIKSEQGLEASTLMEATSNSKPEPSTGKRKRTVMDLDTLPPHEPALTEQTKRLKLEQSPPPPEAIKQLWDRPRYGISAPLNAEMAGFLLNRKAAVEKHFGVRFNYGLFKNELRFYCQPVDTDNILFSEAIELCDPAFRFLNEFLRNSYGKFGCIDDYLKSDDWVAKEKKIEKIGTSDADTHLQGRSELNQ